MAGLPSHVLSDGGGSLHTPPFTFFICVESFRDWVFALVRFLTTQLALVVEARLFLLDFSSGPDSCFLFPFT